MSNYIPQPGHRVRRTQITEGTVVKVEKDIVKFADHSMAMLNPYTGPDVREDAVIWERLPDPEPDWQGGDVAMDNNSKVYIRRFDDEEYFDKYPWVNDGDWVTDDELVRPVVRLVPEKSSND